MKHVNIKISFRTSKKIQYTIDNSKMLEYSASSCIKVLKFCKYTLSIMSKGYFINCTGLDCYDDIKNMFIMLSKFSNIDVDQTFKIDTITSIFNIKLITSSFEDIRNQNLPRSSKFFVKTYPRYYYILILNIFLKYFLKVFWSKS